MLGVLSTVSLSLCHDVIAAMSPGKWLALTSRFTSAPADKSKLCRGLGAWGHLSFLPAFDSGSAWGVVIPQDMRSCDWNKYEWSQRVSSGLDQILAGPARSLSLFFRPPPSFLGLWEDVKVHCDSPLLWGSIYCWTTLSLSLSFVLVFAEHA